MVKLPRALVARWDAARGDVSRPEFLAALLDEYEAKPAPVLGAAQVERQVREAFDRRQSKCSHPATRRIGDGCADCGATGLK